MKPMNKPDAIEFLGYNVASTIEKLEGDSELSDQEITLAIAVLVPTHKILTQLGDRFLLSAKQLNDWLHKLKCIIQIRAIRKLRCMKVKAE